jgi:ribosomal protein L7/L12
MEKFADLISKIEALSVVELNELVKALEEKFGVSAAAMMTAGPAAGAGAEAGEEKTAFAAHLKSAGDNKIAVIKALKEALALGLKEAKDIKNAQALSNALQAKGYRVISGGTDNHLMLVDVFGSKGITGKEAEHALETVGISINKNMVPFDTRKPLDPSGIRLGTPALTTRGAGEIDMALVAKLMDEALQARDNPEKLAEIKQQVTEFYNRAQIRG